MAVDPMPSLPSLPSRAPRRFAPGALAPPSPAGALVALAIMAIAGVAPPRPAGAEILNRVVLRVNDQIATLYDYQRRRAETMRQIVQGIQDPAERRNALDQAPENVFRDMFQELLLSSRADQLAVEVTDQEVDDRLAKIRDSLGMKTEADFQTALRQNEMTLEGLRSQTRKNLRIGEVMQKEVTSKIKVKDEDLRRFYRQHVEQFTVPEQVQLREVVVLEDSGLPAAERGRIAAAIREAVLSGKSLADAVAPHAAKGQASSVVEIGWVSPKDLDPKLEAAAWKLPKDGMTEPVAARGGDHLLQLIDRHPQHVKPFSDVQAAIQQQEQERIFRQDSIKYMADLETRSLVVADPPPEAANFRRRIGGEDESLKGLAGAAADKTPGTGSGASGESGAGGAAGDVTGAHPTAVDTTTDRKQGLPAPTPAGAPPPPKDTVIIPPPSAMPAPPASTPPPSEKQQQPSAPPANPPPPEQEPNAPPPPANPPPPL
jgi:parvulin-like peptidyl-prolyl isomerase